MSKQTILVLASTFPRWKKDTEPRFIYDLCQHLDERFGLIVLAPHCKGAASEEQFGRIRVVRFRYAPERFEKLAYEGGIAAQLGKHPWYWLLVPWFFAGQLLAALKIMRIADLHSIHAHWLIPQGLVAVLANKLSSSPAPLVCTSHGGDLFGFRDAFSIYLKKIVLRHCHQLTVVSQPMVAAVRKLNRAVPISVIPMGVDLRRKFVPSNLAPILPEQILFVGRLVEKKGLTYLLQALPQVLKVYPDTRLTIIGDGPLRDLLKKQVAEYRLQLSVSFHGRCGHAELVSFIQSSGVLVLPFVVATSGDTEGLGLTLVEAMGCAKPVIVGDVAAIHDVVEHEHSGLIVNPKITPELVSSIFHMRRNPQHAQKMGIQARQWAVENFDWSSIGKRYSELMAKNERL